MADEMEWQPVRIRSQKQISEECPFNDGIFDPDWPTGKIVRVRKTSHVDEFGEVDYEVHPEDDFGESGAPLCIHHFDAD